MSMNNVIEWTAENEAIIRVVVASNRDNNIFFILGANIQYNEGN